MSMKLISIITPVFNGSKYITQTIESVINQTYPNWEMVIVNDGSNDNTEEIVQNFSGKESRIRLINQSNGGSASARNNALRNAKGRYISFLDADDIWDNTFLEKQIKFIQKTDAPIVFSSYRRIDENGNIILKDFIVPTKVGYHDLLKTCSISCLTSLFDKDKIGDVYFNEKLKSLRDDFAFWLSILKKGIYAYGNTEVLASYRVFNSSTTGNKWKVIKPHFNIYRKVEKLSLIKSVYYTVHWAQNGLKKYK